MLADRGLRVVLVLATVYALEWFCRVGAAGPLDGLIP